MQALNQRLANQPLLDFINATLRGISQVLLAFVPQPFFDQGSPPPPFPEEFGELMLRHQRLMSRYTEFVTYFLPIDVDADDTISMHEMNTALRSLREPPLSDDEITFLQEQTASQSLTWNRFIEVLLT
jgi:hypothetical protein